MTGATASMIAILLQFLVCFEEIESKLQSSSSLMHLLESVKKLGFNCAIRICLVQRLPLVSLG